MPTDLTYVLLSALLTVWVGRTLTRNGKVFLGDVFRNNMRLAEAMNQLLVVGFYLINLGFVALFLRTIGKVNSLRDAFETLSTKLGVVLVVLGVLHLTNVLIFSRVRRRSLINDFAVTPVQLPPAGVPPTT
ncbi:MAG TPA: hypothetical protein VGM75_04755 [Pseudonocardiaceae bacterium]